MPARTPMISRTEVRAAVVGRNGLNGIPHDRLLLTDSDSEKRSSVSALLTIDQVVDNSTHWIVRMGAQGLSIPKDLLPTSPAVGEKITIIFERYTGPIEEITLSGQTYEWPR